MPRPKRSVTIDDEIAKQEEKVRKFKEDYETNLKKLADMRAKKALFDAIEKSKMSYEEIIALISKEDNNAATY